MLKFQAVPKAKQDAAVLLRRLRWSFGSGWLAGALFALLLGIFFSDLESGKPWWFNVFLLFSVGMNSFVGWLRDKSDREDLAKLIEAQPNPTPSDAP